MLAPPPMETALVMFARAPHARPQTTVQYVAHAGLFASVLWGFLFYRFEPVLFDQWRSWLIRRRRRLREAEADIRRELDNLLEKLHTQGLDSLSRKERSFLRGASEFLKKIQNKED